MKKSPYWPDGVPHEISGYNRPLYDLLDESARDYPNMTYTIFQGACRTFREVKECADRVASFLLEHSISRGDRVAIFLPNIPQFPVIYFGILKAGAICVPCNPLYTAEELRFQLKDSGARMVFCMDHPKFYRTTLDAIASTAVETVVVCNMKKWLPPLKALVGSLLGRIPRAGEYQKGHLFLDDILETYPPLEENVEVNPQEDPAVIIYTGGTTGVPKGAVLTHSNLVFDVMAMDAYIRISHEPGAPLESPYRGGYHCYLGVLPWYHSFGMTVCMLGACAGGSRLICVPDPRAGNPPFTEVLKAVQRYRPTFVVGVPTLYSAFVNHPLIDKFDLTSIICCASGGAPLPVQLAREFEEKTGCIIFEGYGLSETSPVICANPSIKERRRFGTVGFPLPNTEIKIVDVDTGDNEMPPGEDGEIAVSGPQVMKGYWRNPQADTQVFREIDGKRFFLTGDIGHIDKDGYLVITDRKKDLILVGGFNCYPREVEEVLYSHPKVAQAAVIGIPHPRSGEVVKAFVVLKEGEYATEEEIIEFCRERLAGYKRPREVEFRKSLPTSAVGKVLRRVLREEEMQRLENSKGK